jgi:hypothetical protein
MAITELRVTIENGHKVPSKQWAKWSIRAKYLFNRVYESMLLDERFFSHPEARAVLPEHWKVTAWNAAFTAACEVDKCAL